MVADITVGEGKRPVRDERVCIDYTAWFEGTLVEHSLDREECLWIRFQPGQAVDGLIEGIASMREGGVRQLRVPANLRNGATLGGDLPREGTVLYEVRLIRAMQRAR